MPQQLDDLIFDRTQSDVSRVQSLTQKMIAGTATEAEKAEWLGGMKGAYNAADLNRVIAAMDYLNEYFLGLGYDVGYTRISVTHQPEPSILPDGYTQLEYIQSSGTQYIDTGFKPNQDTRVVLTYNASNNTSGYIYGSQTAWQVNSFALFTRLVAYGDSAISYTATYNININTDFNKSVFSDSIGNLHDFGAKTFSSGLNLFIFAENRNGTFNEPFSGKIVGHVKIYDNGMISRDFVPCSNPNGEIGFYDIVEGSFYGNNGEGAFIAGPEIEPEKKPTDGPTKDPYTWYEDDIPTQNEMSIYIENVQRLRDKIPYPPGTPDAPSDMELLTYQEANDIEKILYTLESELLAMQENFLLRQANTLFMIAGGVFNG